jgi:Ser/Thr protein kinase RdoA (MazF antagonist)
MKPFEQLTEQGQAWRLRQVALRALQQYDLDSKQIRFLATHTNTLFRVDTSGGEKYALRISKPGEHDLHDTELEISWLDAIKRETDLRIVEPIRNRQGEYITFIESPHVPGPRRCILFTWLPGRPLIDQLTPENYYKLGVLSAQLHDHAETFAPPAYLHPMRWDCVFYYHHDPIVIYEEQYAHLVSPERRALLDQAIPRAERVLRALHTNPEGRIVIHGDLHWNNVHCHRGKLYVFDFEDVMLGYPVQDIAITLYYGRTREQYPKLRTAFEQGYTSRRPWPVQFDSQLETLMAARSLMFINYVTHSEPDPQEDLDWLFERVQAFLERFPGS